MIHARFAVVAGLAVLGASCANDVSIVPGNQGQDSLVPAADADQTSGVELPASANIAPTGPSAEMLAVFFPISGTEMASVNYIVHASFNELLRRRGECLETEGFNLDFESTMPPDVVPRYQSYPAYDSLRKYGFNMRRPPGFPPGVAYVEDDLQNGLDGLVPLPEGVTESEARALVETYNDCARQQEQGENLPLFEQLRETYRELDLNFSLLVNEIDLSEPDVVAAFEEFQACVTDRGWELDVIAGDGSKVVTDSPFFGAVDAAVLKEDDPVAERELELRAAADYADCMAPVEEARMPLRAALREGYVDEHLPDMIELELQFRRALGELGLGS